MLLIAELLYPPGAGFAAAGSLIVLLATFGLMSLAVLGLGRFAWRRFKARRGRA